ncbi:hypothetical protein O3P69_009063 [Scylla paramamosain]|uniref:Uncharacterized protein n=1 Tax=Scylla paramamosain TaxID=85552 RepID=A0AAW0TQQ5_SCYPA
MVMTRVSTEVEVVVEETRFGIAVKMMCEGSGSLLAVVRILAYLEGAWRALQKAARGGAGGGSVSEERVELRAELVSSRGGAAWLARQTRQHVNHLVRTQRVLENPALRPVMISLHALVGLDVTERLLEVPGGWNWGSGQCEASSTPPPPPPPTALFHASSMPPSSTQSRRTTDPPAPLPHLSLGTCEAVTSEGGRQVVGVWGSLTSMPHSCGSL